jgi:Zn-dependent protease with chaperone function
LRYLPKESVNPNIDTRPASGHLWILIRLSLIVVVGYFVLMFAFGWIGRHVPLSLERRLFHPIANRLLSAGLSTKDPRAMVATSIFEKLKHASEFKDVDLDFRVVESSEENAYAVPGGIVVVNTELIEKSASENEVAMVIGHELGHVAHRDVVASLGRVLLLVASSFVSSTGDNSATLLSSGNFMQLAYSRAQESAADEFGVKLLAQAYGTTAGAADFFKRHLEDDKGALLARTHPLSADRIDKILVVAKALGKESGVILPIRLKAKS